MRRGDASAVVVALALGGVLASLGPSCGTQGTSFPAEANLTLEVSHRVLVGARDDAGVHVWVDGGEWLLSRALVVLSTVDVIPCPTSTQGRWRWLSPIGSAWAHGITTPKHLAVPGVVDLLAEDGGEQRLGRLSPPAGSYCQARVSLAPIDAYSAGVAGVPELTGRSLELVGVWAPSSGEAPSAFALTSTELASSQLTLAAVPFDGGAEVALGFVLDLTAVLGGLDLAADGGADRALAGLAGSLTLAP